MICLMGLFFTKKSRYWQQKLGTFTPKAPPTLAEAFKIFDHLANLPHITHDYLPSGCDARAHLMCVELLKRGHLPRKAWAFERPNKPLYMSMPTANQKYWVYHVAPVLLVDAGPAQGGLIPLVFDPAAFDGPVSPATWAASMGADNRDVQLVQLGHSPAGYRGDYLPYTSGNRNDLLAFTNTQTDAHAMKRMTDIRREIGTPQQRTVLSCGLREAQYTALWRTEGAVAPALAHAAMRRQTPATHSPRL